MRLCVLCVGISGRNSFKGGGGGGGGGGKRGECKTREKSNFSEKWKNNKLLE